MSEIFATLKTFLEKMTVMDVIPKTSSDKNRVGGAVMVLDSRSSLLHALKALTARRVLSAPVRDAESKKFVGFVDMLDLVTAAALMESGKAIVDTLAKKEVSWDEFIAQENKVFAEESISGLPNASERNPFVTVASTDSLADLLRVFARSPNMHRVAVVASKGDAESGEVESLLAIVTQSDLIAFLASKLFNMPAAAQTLSESDIKGQRHPVTVAETATALEGFQKMVDEKVSAVGVTNADGRLVAVLSASDFKRSANWNVFADLHLSVRDYLALAPPPHREGAPAKPDADPTEPLASPGRAPAVDDARTASFTPITCTVAMSMLDLLQKLNEVRVHRAFIVDPESGKPLGVISLYDIILWFLAVTGLESVSSKPVSNK